MEEPLPVLGRGNFKVTAYQNVRMAVDKQIVAYSYNGTLLRNEKKGTTDIYNNMGESRKHDAEKSQTSTNTYCTNPFI